MNRRSLVLAAIICLSGASAEAYYCSRPSEPYIPSAYAADYDRMQRVQDEVADYFEDMSGYVECLNSEINDSLSEASDVNDEWSRTVNQFNNQ